MTLYWLYDLPSWLFAFIVIALFVTFGLVGLFLTRGWIRRLHGVDHSHNDIVGFFLAALTVFYGITLGLVAVGTWITFSAANEKVDAEVQIVASLYRDAGSYQEPSRSQLRITTTWFFDARSYQMHGWMTVQACALLGLIVFMIGILDNPFRGKVSVGSGPLELVYRQLVRSPARGDALPPPIRFDRPST